MDTGHFESGHISIHERLSLGNAEQNCLIWEYSTCPIWSSNCSCGIRNHTTKVLSNYHIVISSSEEEQLKFIMELKSTYPKLFLDTFELSTIERNLEKMFVVDSAAAFFEDKFKNDYNKNKIDKLKEFIEFEENSYFVWYNG